MGKKHHAEEGGKERYIITYADLITLLLVLFILLFAVSSIDINKYAALAYALTEGFGKTPGAMPGEKPIFDEPGQSVFDAGGYANTQNPVKMFDYDNITDEISAMAEELDLEFESRGVGTQGKKTGGGEQGSSAQKEKGAAGQQQGQGAQNEIGNQGNPNKTAQDQGQAGKTAQDQGSIGKDANQLGQGQDINIGKEQGKIGTEGQDQGQAGQAGQEAGQIGKDANAGAGKDTNIGKDKALAGKNDKEKGQVGKTGQEAGQVGKDANAGAGKDVNIGKDKALIGKDDKDVGQKGKVGSEQGSVGKKANELGQGKEDNIGKDKGQIGQTGQELGQKGQLGEDQGQKGTSGADSGNQGDQGDQANPEGMDGTQNPLGLVKAGIRIVATARGLEIRLTPSDVLFYSGSATLTPKAIKVINRLAQIIAKYDTNHSILVEGHTDSDRIRPGGRFKDNFELSTGRAYSVMQRLAFNGISANRMGLAGYGEWHPIASNKTVEGKQANRRVVIVLLNPQMALPVNEVNEMNNKQNRTEKDETGMEPKGILMYE